MKKKVTANGGKTKTRNKKAKEYQAHHLAALLFCILLLEGALFSLSTSSDWQQAVTVLDVTDGVDQTAHDMSMTFGPVFDVVADINQFYQLSATEMMQLLDLSDSSTGWEISNVYLGIRDFYEQSSIQMALLLDVSNTSLWPARIAGAAIVK